MLKSVVLSVKVGYEVLCAFRKIHYCLQVYDLCASRLNGWKSLGKQIQISDVSFHYKAGVICNYCSAAESTSHFPLCKSQNYSIEGGKANTLFHKYTIPYIDYLRIALLGFCCTFAAKVKKLYAIRPA